MSATSRSRLVRQCGATGGRTRHIDRSKPEAARLRGFQPGGRLGCDFGYASARRRQAMVRRGMTAVRIAAMAAMCAGLASVGPMEAGVVLLAQEGHPLTGTWTG